MNKITPIIDITPEQVRQLADLIPTSVNSLRHVVSGVHGVSALRAIEIEHAAAKIGLHIPRESLNSGCAKCEFAAACRKVARTTLKPVMKVGLKARPKPLPQTKALGTVKTPAVTRAISAAKKAAKAAEKVAGAPAKKLVTRSKR